MKKIGLVILIVIILCSFIIWYLDFKENQPYKINSNNVLKLEFSIDRGKIYTNPADKTFIEDFCKVYNKGNIIKKPPETTPSIGLKIYLKNNNIIEMGIVTAESHVIRINDEKYNGMKNRDLNEYIKNTFGLTYQDF